MMDTSGRVELIIRAEFAPNKVMKTSVNIPFNQRILYLHLGA